jgi:hypothetical protein
MDKFRRTFSIALLSLVFALCSCVNTDVEQEVQDWADEQARSETKRPKCTIRIDSSGRCATH